MAKTLAMKTQGFIQQYGIKTVVFTTFTFAENVTDPKECQRRWNHLATKVLRDRYGYFIWVKERQMRGAWHYHCLFSLGEDIHTDVNFDELRNKALPGKARYRSAGPRLRAEWKFLRTTAPRYGFGRPSAEPIRSNAEAVSRYLAKYLSKQFDGRGQWDKGVRLFGDGNKQLAHFTVNSSWSHARGVARQWRAQVDALLKEMGWQSTDDLKERFGKSWAFFLGPAIRQIDLTQHGYVFDSPEEEETFKARELRSNIPQFIQQPKRRRVSPAERQANRYPTHYDVDAELDRFEQFQRPLAERVPQGIIIDHTDEVTRLNERMAMDAPPPERVKPPSEVPGGFTEKSMDRCEANPF